MIRCIGASAGGTASGGGALGQRDRHLQYDSPGQPRIGAQANPLTTKLEQFVCFTADEILALDRLTNTAKFLLAGQDLIREGERPEQISLIVSGMACRYKLLADGRRQILALLIPGDLCEVEFGRFSWPDHSIALLGDALISSVSFAQLAGLRVQYPRFDRALSLSELIETATLREWLLNLGQRNAMQRIGHLFCELRVRLRAIGHLHDDGSFDLPINQAVLADITGLTTVHVNRTLQRLRAEGLIELKQRRLVIRQPEKLVELCGFDDNYLRVAR